RLILRSINILHSQAIPSTTHLVAILILIPVMLWGDPVLLLLDLSTKSKVTVNICSIELLSSFWVKMVWF
ncbi:hypothetical protein PAXRUDRAFT_836326, partial [Paxillus rubicundulus Ve08.2h10]